MKKTVKWLIKLAFRIMGEVVITLIDLYAVLILGLNKLIRSTLWRILCKNEDPKDLNLVVNVGYKSIIDKMYPNEYSDEEE